MKKFLKFLWFVPLVLCVAFAFIGCLGGGDNSDNGDGDGESPHEHRYDPNYDYDDTHHWLNPICDDTTEIKDYEEHTLDEKIQRQPTCSYLGLAYYDCTKCRYRLSDVELPMLEHTYSQEWLPLADAHVHICTSCYRSYVDVTDHDYVNGKCKDCGYSDGNGNLSYVTSITAEGTYVTIKGIEDATAQTVVIPSHIGGVPVTKIDENAFINNENIESVTIGYNVTTIGKSAFERCNNLTKVVFGDGVTSVERRAFFGCKNLEEVTFNEGLETIGDTAFLATAVREIELPSTLKTLSERAFWECRSLTELILPDGVEIIGTEAVSEGAFVEDGNAYWLGSKTNPHLVLVKQKDDDITELTIPDGCKILYYNALNGCEELESINIPSSVTTIYGGALNNCPKLTTLTVSQDNTVFCSENNIVYSKDKKTLVRAASGMNTVVVPVGVENIGEYAFYKSKLAYLNIVDCTTLKTIGKDAFAYCSMSYVPLPAGLTAIGDYAFFHCDNLTTVDIPATVTAIGDSAFAQCNLLTEINYGGTCEQWKASVKGYLSSVEFTVKCTDGNIKYNEPKE